MSHGYECDSCGTFVEQGMRLSGEPPADGTGEEVVRVACPNDEGCDERVHEWTLCPDCRDRVIGMVEGRAD